MNILDKHDLNSLTDLEFEIYHYIISNSEKFPYMTIRQLADEVHVSTTTIINFCKKLNCHGFSEFKIKFRLAQEKNKGKRLSGDSSLTNFFTTTTTPSFQNRLDKISNIILTSDNIISIGFGQSGTIARYASSYFTSLGTFCLYLDSPFLNIGNATIQNNTALIFSVHGEFKNVLSSVRSLKLNGCTIISVTNTDNCTLAKLSDYNLAYHIQCEDVICEGMQMDITTQIPAMYIAEQLAKRVYNLSLQD